MYDAIEQHLVMLDSPPYLGRTAARCTIVSKSVVIPESAHWSSDRVVINGLEHWPWATAV